MMKKIIKLSASVLATVVLSLACGHGTAAMNRAATVSVFSPNNSTLPMSTSTASGTAGFGSTAASSGLNKAAIGSSSSAMISNSSVAGSTNVSDNSGNNPANNSGKSDNGSCTVTRSGDSGKTNDGSGAEAAPKGSGSSGNKGTETPAAPAKPSGGTPAPAPKAPAAPTVTPYNISADQQAIIAYGRSKGLIYNPNLRPENTTWSGYDDLLIDVASDNDIIKSGKDDINGMLRAGYAGADFYPYFEKKSSKTNNYYFYVLWG